MEHEKKNLQKNLTGELFQARLQLKKKDDEIFILKDDLEKMEEELAEFEKAKGNEVHGDQQQIQAGLTSQIRELDAKNQQLQSELNSERDKIAKVAMLEKRIESLQQELKVFGMEKDQLESENIRHRDRQEAEREQVKQNKAQEEALQVLQKEIKDQLAELDVENKNLAKTLANKSAEFEEMLIEKDETIADMKDTMEQLKKNLDTNDSTSFC